MSKLPVRVLAALAIAAACGTAAAQTLATTAKAVHLRAGPARTYPVVAVLPPRTAVTVYGCMTGYSWCDIAAGPDRGWVYAGNLLYPYENREVLLPGVAAVIGIGIVGFLIDDYWRDHYVGRSWYPQRHRWVPPPPRALPPRAMPPRPLPHAAPGVRPLPPPRPAPHAAPAPRIAPRHAAPAHGNPPPHPPRGH